MVDTYTMIHTKWVVHEKVRHIVVHKYYDTVACTMSHVTYPYFLITIIIRRSPILATPHVNNSKVHYPPHSPSCSPTSTLSRSMLTARPPRFWLRPWAPYPRWPPRMQPWTPPDRKPEQKHKPLSKRDLETKCECQPEREYPHHVHVHHGPWSKPRHECQRHLPITGCADKVHHSSLSMRKCRGLSIGQRVCSLDTHGGTEIANIRLAKGYWRGEGVSLRRSHPPTSM